jgi:hypothetical protein
MEMPDWLKSTSYKQLELELGPLEISLNQYLANPPQPVKPLKIQYANEAKAYLVQATEALRKNKVQNAWALYYKAELRQYHLKESDEIKARAGRILFESTPLLSNSDKKVVRTLIGKAAENGSWDLKDDLDTNKVIEARRIIQDYYSNKYIYLGLTMQLLFVLAVIMVSLSSIVAVTITMIPTEVAIVGNNMLFWLTIGLLGGIGGSISGLFGLKESFASETDMPERVLNKWITAAKPVIGSGAALIIAIFVFAGFVEVANIQVSTYLIFALAFVSGFSERLIIGAVASRLPS